MLAARLAIARKRCGQAKGEVPTKFSVNLDPPRFSVNFVRPLFTKFSVNLDPPRFTLNFVRPLPTKFIVNFLSRTSILEVTLWSTDISAGKWERLEPTENCELVEAAGCFLNAEQRRSSLRET